MGDRPWLGGPTVVMLSAVGGPLAPSVAAVHGAGGPSMHDLRTWSGGSIVGGPLHGSVIDRPQRSNALFTIVS